MEAVNFYETLLALQKTVNLLVKFVMISNLTP